MICPNDELLRARIDGELNASEAGEVENHLGECGECRARAERLELQAREAREIFSALAPGANEAISDPGLALARFKARLRAQPEHASLLSRLFARRLRPAWAAMGMTLVALGLLGFAPARTWAQRILAMLRVQKVAVVPVDFKALDSANGGNAGMKVLAQMLSQNTVVTMHSEPLAVPDAETASQRAGYTVKLLSGRADSPKLTVMGEQAFHMNIDRERAQGVLTELGHPEVNLPASLDGATIAVHVSPMVMAQYGNCPNEKPKPSGNAEATQSGNSTQDTDVSDCVVLAQAPSPTVSVPPELNLAELAQAVLQVAGMSAEEARTFSQNVDWTSTLVIPIPRFVQATETVSVNGVEGTLITTPAARWPAGYTLIWVKNGIIYSLMASGNSSDAVPLAESLN